MNIHEAAHSLATRLKNDLNIQAVGIRENNIEEYKKHPDRFRKEITEDSLVVYTIDDPTDAELILDSCESFKVKWVKIGRLVS